MEMFRELAPGCNATCGLSNISNGTPEKMRPLLNRTYLVMLEKYGMNFRYRERFWKRTGSAYQEERKGRDKETHLGGDGWNRTGDK